MARSAEFWDQLRAVFNTDDVLVEGPSRNFYCEREYSPFDDIHLVFRKTAQPARPPVVCFTGHRGSGKTTMLLRLLEEFKDDYFIVYFDIEHNLDSRVINQVDVLYLLGATIFQVAAKEGHQIAKSHLEALAKSVYAISQGAKQTSDDAKNIDEAVKGLVCFGASMMGGGLGEKLAEALVKPFTFTSKVDDAAARDRQNESRIQQVITNINIIISEAQRQSGKPPLIVVDGLDKLQRLDQAKQIFLESRALRGPVCRIIYTVPMLIFNSPLFGQAEETARSYMLPNVRLYEKSDGQKYENGCELMRQVVGKRLESLNLKADDLFEADTLDILIFKSGGVMRWLIGLIRDACSAAEIKGFDRINREATMKAVDDRAAALSGRLSREAVKELREVRKAKRHSGTPESDELLHGLLIVAYRGPGTWFDAHPLIWDEL